MKMRWVTALALVFMTAPAVAQSPRPVFDFSGLVEKLRPSVVTLDVTKVGAAPRQLPMPPDIEKYFGRDKPQAPREFKEGGTGIVFDAAKGLIVTSDYVVAGANTIEVFLANGNVREAHVVGVDQASGIGLVRIDPQDLVALTWSDRPARVGEPILGLASAYGMEAIATSGVVAAVDPDFHTTDSPFEILQEVILLDLPAHRGAAGGLIVAQDGAVIGMTMGQYGTTGDANFNLGVAIPAAEVRRVASILERGGTVERGRIGVVIQSRPGRGVMVTEVEKGSPAERAGIVVGDFVKSAGGQPVKSDRVLTRLIARHPIGATLSMAIERDGRALEVSLTVERRTDN